MLSLFGKNKSDTTLPEGAAAVAAKPVKKKSWAKWLFGDDVPGDKPLAKPGAEYKRYVRLVWRVKIQAVIIIVLFGVLMIAIPIFKPASIYYARRLGAPLGTEKRLVELDKPVLTAQAITSWAMTTVTEVLTFNFANFNDRISMFAGRFTPEGWSAFAKALYEAETIDRFKKQNLVATAAPSDPAMIESEGFNLESGEYEWKIIVPIILKFVTNNNVSESRNITVHITAVRVPTTQTPEGIAIKLWQER